MFVHAVVNPDTNPPAAQCRFSWLGALLPAYFTAAGIVTAFTHCGWEILDDSRPPECR